MKRLFRWLLEILCLAYVIGFVLMLAESRGLELPELLKGYAHRFHKVLDAFMLSGLFGIVFLACFIFVLIWMNKKMGWRDLASRYSLSKDRFRQLRPRLVSSQAYMNNLRYNGIHIGLVPEGIVLKHPFPFSCFSTGLLLPWSDIEVVRITRNPFPKGSRRHLQHFFSRLMRSKYLEVKLRFFPEHTIFLWWENEWRSVIPGNIKFETGE
jgi:hypothetical protein